MFKSRLNCWGINHLPKDRMENYRWFYMRTGSNSSCSATIPHKVLDTWHKTPQPVAMAAMVSSFPKGQGWTALTGVSQHTSPGFREAACTQPRVLYKCSLHHRRSGRSGRSFTGSDCPDLYRSNRRLHGGALVSCTPGSRCRVVAWRCDLGLIHGFSCGNCLGTIG